MAMAAAGLRRTVFVTEVFRHCVMRHMRCASSPFEVLKGLLDVSRLSPTLAAVYAIDQMVWEPLRLSMAWRNLASPAIDGQYDCKNLVIHQRDACGGGHQLVCRTNFTVLLVALLVVLVVPLEAPTSAGESATHQSLHEKAGKLLPIAVLGPCLQRECTVNSVVRGAPMHIWS